MSDLFNLVYTKNICTYILFLLGLLITPNLFAQMGTLRENKQLRNGYKSFATIKDKAVISTKQDLVSTKFICN